MVRSSEHEQLDLLEVELRLEVELKLLPELPLEPDGLEGVEEVDWLEELEEEDIIADVGS